MDMSSLVPMSLCNSRQNVDVNLVSRSDTIDLGTPWSLMTSLRNSHATSFAVTHVVVSTSVEAYAYMHKVNPNIFPHLLSFYMCITILLLFAHHSNFF